MALPRQKNVYELIKVNVRQLTVIRLRKVYLSLHYNFAPARQLF